MFSSNQIFDITCEARDLPMVLDFAADLEGSKELFTRSDGRITPAYAMPVPGVYAIGRGSMEPYKTGPNKGWAGKLGRGWTDFPFEWDARLVSGILEQWLAKNPPDGSARPHTDGSVHPGFRVRAIRCMDDTLPPPYRLSDWDWQDAVVTVTPCWMRYDK